MKVWADFYDWVLPDLPGVSQELATQHIRSAAIEFFNDSLIYVVDHDAITTVEDQASYDLEFPAGYELAVITEAYFGTSALIERSADQLRQLYPEWTAVYGSPLCFTQETTDTFRLVPYPDQVFDDTITLRMALKPTRTSRGIEDWIFNRWLEVIAEGAKSRLMYMKDKPWTDDKRAVDCRNKFLHGVARARAAGITGMTRTILQVRVPRI